jgi:hypothetical protein
MSCESLNCEQMVNIRSQVPVIYKLSIVDQSNILLDNKRSQAFLIVSLWNVCFD